MEGKTLSSTVKKRLSLSNSAMTEWSWLHASNDLYIYKTTIKEKKVKKFRGRRPKYAQSKHVYFTNNNDDVNNNNNC